MKQTKTYRERPTASAKAARRAWDYFSRAHATRSRGISELFYSPSYHGDGPHWVCILEVLTHDTMKWKFSSEDVTWAEPAYRLANPDGSRTLGRGR